MIINREIKTPKDIYETLMKIEKNLKQDAYDLTNKIKGETIIVDRELERKVSNTYNILNKIAEKILSSWYTVTEENLTEQQRRQCIITITGRIHRLEDLLDSIVERTPEKPINARFNLEESIFITPIKDSCEKVCTMPPQFELTRITKNNPQQYVRAIKIILKQLKNQSR